VIVRRTALALVPLLALGCGTPAPRAVEPAAVAEPAAAAEPAPSPPREEPAPPPPRPDTVTITTDPAEAEILDADGALLGNAPMTLPREDGPLRLRVQQPGYEPKEIVIEPGDPDRREVRLARRPSSRRPRAAPPATDLVRVISAPAGAEVFDASGTLLGNTPFELPRPDGSVELVLRAPGHRDLEVRVDGGTPPELEVWLRTVSGGTPAVPAPRRPSRSRAYAGPDGMWDCSSTSSRCRVGPQVIGLTAREVRAALGPPHRREGPVWHYTYRSGGMMGVRTDVRLRIRRGRVVGASASLLDLSDIVCP
jgi:hypothetical protein